MKNIIHNIIQNFYCDLIIILTGKLTSYEKILFILYKYTINLFKMVFKIKVVSIFGNTFHVYNNIGVLNFQIMFKDFYDFYGVKLKKKPVIFDVGANIGDFSLVASRYYSNPVIHSFEPIVYTYSLLAENCRNYPNIHCNNIGLGNTDGKMNFFFTEEESDRGSFSKENFTKGNIKEESVDILTMDNYCETNKITAVDLLKIDVEGFEYNVLLGGVKTLASTSNIIVECHLNKDEDGFFRIYNFLKENGFKFRKFGKIWYDKKNDTIAVFDALFYR